MNYVKYLDFDDLFHNFNKDILLNSEKYIRNCIGKNAYLYFTVIELNNNHCSLDLGQLIYTPLKFYKLISTYVDLNSWDIFKEEMKKNKGTSLTFYFNSSKKKMGSMSNNKPCIISMVFTKEKKEFNEVNIYYRTTEVNRIFGVDLILFYKLLKDLEEDPDLKEILKINIIRIILPISFISLYNVSLILKLENIKIEDLPENKITYNILNNLINLQESSLSSYKKKKRMQLLISNSLKLKSINIDSLKLRKEN